MNHVKNFKNINKKREYNITIIILITLIMFLVYGIVLKSLLSKENPLILKNEEIKYISNLLFSIMGVLSCLFCYNSSKKNELFIVALMYVMFFMDISSGKTTGYMISLEYEYYAILTSFVRLCIICISVNESNKFREMIINNKLKSLIFFSIISILSIYIEYKYMLPYSNYIINICKNCNILIAVIYGLISINFFIKSINTKDYIYGIIGVSCFTFSIKAIYIFCYFVSKNKYILLASNSITSIGFIIFIVSVFIELYKTMNINKALDERISLFIKIIDENKYKNIIICDEYYKILYKNKTSIDNIRLDEYINNLDIQLQDRFDIEKVFNNGIKLDKIENELCKNGSYVTSIYENNYSVLDLRVSLYEINNKKYKVIEIKDISEKYKLEKAFLEYESMKKEELMKREFFANISHELKTPLNIIYSTKQLLDMSKDKSDFNDIYTRYSSSLNINCKRMLRLIDNIVDITKLNSGYQTPNFKNYNIVSIIEDMTLSVANYAEVKGIDLTFDTDEEDLTIKCDLDMLERIILNLLSNAIKFSDRGSNILVKISNNQKWIKITVKDSGIGIDAKVKDKIFDRFVQGDKSIRRKKEGSGIGLSIVKKSVELMNGEISVESDGKTGTEFTILLPNEIVDLKDEVIDVDYSVDLQKIHTELSDIYELYDYLH